jgi:hypothetical protein
MSDKLDQIKEKIETAISHGVGAVKKAIGIGKTEAAKAVTAAEPTVAQAKAAVAQATTKLEADADATLAAGHPGGPGELVPTTAIV